MGAGERRDVRALSREQGSNSITGTACKRSNGAQRDCGARPAYEVTPSSGIDPQILGDHSVQPPPLFESDAVNHTAEGEFVVVEEL